MHNVDGHAHDDGSREEGEDAEHLGLVVHVLDAAPEEASGEGDAVPPALRPRSFGGHCRLRGYLWLLVSGPQAAGEDQPVGGRRTAGLVPVDAV